MEYAFSEKPYLLSPTFTYLLLVTLTDHLIYHLSETGQYNHYIVSKKCRDNDLWVVRVPSAFISDCQQFKTYT